MYTRACSFSSQETHGTAFTKVAPSDGAGGRAAPAQHQ